MLSSSTKDEVLALLPETAESLDTLASLGEIDMAVYLKDWQQGREGARLKHMTFQLSQSQLETVEVAIDRALTGRSVSDDNPNPKGNALTAICNFYLNHRGVV